ncbi:MAG: PQQ-dependent sugar dehydrogenase [Burkholderiaceae bacterium]|nr:PQQ-dependent sugar dehydrogenase [Burkholderiaceae bacterium]
MQLRRIALLIGLVALGACSSPSPDGGTGGGGGGTTPPPPPPPPPVQGLDARPSNTTCLAGEAPTTQVTLALQRAFPSLSFSSPILLLQAPGSSTRWFVVEQAGRVRVFNNDAAVAATTLFVDIAARVRSGGEMGLLGLAFHPQFPTDPRVYLSYTTGSPQLVSRVSEFRSTDGGATLDGGSERILLTVNQPDTNHNGGHIAFGPDGFLYIGLGDGGSGGDPYGAIGNGQNLQTLLGKMLRIDISGDTGTVRYRIPAGNPYAGNALCSTGSGTQNCPEIFAFGLRNPWRWSFDTGSNELWLGDVGQGALEEINRITAGGNYGWRCREGTNPFNSNCGPAQNLIDPIAQYGRAAGASVTGGYVYRGTAIPALAGRYVFGDFVSGRIWHIARDTPPTLTVSTGFDSGLQIASFGQGSDGEIFVVHYGGTLHRLVAGGGTGGGTIPTQLSATGCVSASNATQPASGLIPYAPNAAFWSDGASKTRYLALPNGQNITVGSDGDWDFPNGSVLVKNFAIGSRLVETRLFMRHTNGNWGGYTYEWNTAGTDATRVIGGKTVQVAGQGWVFPSEAQCFSCHTQASGRSLGLETAQLNGNLLYAATNRTANQIVTLNAIGTLSPPITATPASLPSMPDPYGSAGTAAERARAWLHTNCSHCHRPGGGTPTSLDLRYTTALAQTNACDIAPQAGDLGIANARLIAPGSAARSIVVARSNRRDAAAMPPLASTRVDTAGVAVLSNWINALTSCN